MKRWIAMVLLAAMLLSGCGSTSTDLTARYIPRSVETETETQVNAADFAVELFKNSAAAGGNTLVSPLSVLYALAMTANGAEEETLAQMEQVLGTDRESLNRWSYSYLKALDQDDMLRLANGIWFNTHERFEADPDFLQTNADYYGASIYGAPFDRTTVAEINNWVEDQTDGIVRDILNEIPDDAVMYLVNALAFEAEWVDVYEKNQVRDGFFTTEDGRKLYVELMHGEDGRYLETDNATGFMRYYKGGDYAFAALLPREGTTVAQLVESLEGEALAALLSQPQMVPVRTAIPKFETACSLNMNDILMEMGMTDAFDPELANLTGLGTSMAGNIFIGRVLHKTCICVAEKGTRAGAATVVEANDTAMGMGDLREVKLDRPFIYMIVDCSENLPIFMGTCMEVGS